MKLGFPFIHIRHVCHCQALATQKITKCITVFARCNVSVWREVSYFGGETYITNGAVALVSRLVAGMSLRNSGFEAKSFHLRFVVDKGFSQSTSALPCQYHSTNASNSFIHLSPTLYNHNRTQTQLQMPKNKFPRETFGCLYEVSDAFGVLHNIPIHEL